MGYIFLGRRPSKRQRCLICSFPSNSTPPMIGESARNWQINVQPRIIGLIKYSRVEHWVYGLILGLTHPMHSSFSSNARTCFSQTYERNTAGSDLKRHEPEKNWSIFYLIAQYCSAAFSKKLHVRLCELCAKVEQFHVVPHSLILRSWQLDPSLCNFLFFIIDCFWASSDWNLSTGLWLLKRNSHSLPNAMCVFGDETVIQTRSYVDQSKA